MTTASTRPASRVLMTLAMFAADADGDGVEQLKRGSVSTMVVAGVCLVKDAAAAGVEELSSYCRTCVVIGTR